MRPLNIHSFTHMHRACVLLKTLSTLLVVLFAENRAMDKDKPVLNGMIRWCNHRSQRKNHLKKAQLERMFDSTSLFPNVYISAALNKSIQNERFRSICKCLHYRVLKSSISVDAKQRLCFIKWKHSNVDIT